MKLVTFVEASEPELGAVEGDAVVPLSRLLPALGNDMRRLIARFPELEAVREARSSVPRARVRLLAPIPRPGKILRGRDRGSRSVTVTSPVAG